MKTLILIVEDDGNTVKALTHLLEKLGSISEAAKNMSEAERLCKHIDFDAIILDLMLPCVRGTDSVRRMKAAAPRTPVIVASGWVNMSKDMDVQKLLDLGAVAALNKSDLNSKTLKDALDVALIHRETLCCGE